MLKNNKIIFLFIQKFNHAMHRNLNSFSVPYNKKIIILLIKFLIPWRVVLSFFIKDKIIYIFLPINHNFCYFMHSPNNRRTSFSCISSYLSHINKSSVPLVRDFYILQTKKGFLSFEDALLFKEGGTLFLVISFFDKKQLQKKKHICF